MADQAEEVQRILEAIAALEEISDDEARAKAVTAVLDQWPYQHTRLREVRQRAVLNLRAQGKTWKQIGDILGVHFTRARQIAQGQRGDKNRPPRRSPRPSADEQ